MAVDLTVTQLGGSLDPGVQADVVWVAGDSASNPARWVPKDGDILLARNIDSSTHTVTLLGAADGQGRSADTAEVLAARDAAGELAVFGPLKLSGWKQTGGYIHVNVDDNNIELAVLRQEGAA